MPRTALRRRRCRLSVELSATNATRRVTLPRTARLLGAVSKMYDVLDGPAGYG